MAKIIKYDDISEIAKKNNLGIPETLSLALKNGYKIYFSAEDSKKFADIACEYENYKKDIIEKYLKEMENTNLDEYEKRIEAEKAGRDYSKLTKTEKNEIKEKTKKKNTKLKEMGKNAKIIRSNLDKDAEYKEALSPYAEKMPYADAKAKFDELNELEEKGLLFDLSEFENLVPMTEKSRKEVANLKEGL